MKFIIFMNQINVVRIQPGHGDFWISEELLT